MLAKTLKELRISNGLTQKQVADKLNIDRSTYSYYELGKINPSIEALSVLSNIYGMSIDDIVNYDSQSVIEKISAPSVSYEVNLNAVLTKDESKLLSCYRQLSKSEQEKYLISLVNVIRNKTENN